MSVKKRLRSFCKNFSSYEKVPEEFPDETELDSYYVHIIFGICQSQHRIAWISQSYNKMSFTIKLYQFCKLKTQQRFVLQEELNTSERELVSLVDSLRDFLKTFDKASKCIQSP